MVRRTIKVDYKLISVSKIQFIYKMRPFDKKKLFTSKPSNKENVTKNIGL